MKKIVQLKIIIHSGQIMAKKILNNITMITGYSTENKIITSTVNGLKSILRQEGLSYETFIDNEIINSSKLLYRLSDMLERLFLDQNISGKIIINNSIINIGYAKINENLKAEFYDKIFSYCC